ncbi:MAG: bifunctional DNA-formamidopyrimidine glycosylase/DNA-(apurinic or apyrimidinic site) lyase [Ardenticatenaceae bacterium]|nr:bifunctional DNA-formamidopyrimidine glycosylase/DNA-(apurinic or apyrimidinic site) lyase [Anaerolineales bacterium]MCB8920115.1 bifunctional DNA-formamidopyrimidine glycosylase/DNA-(apurinic or apyrimidinic site) lyase [Ardenticatenaceae bacterium]MCB8991808.1 bifunctional DNA-formamidopyrimidine glycosylase/DNA-(apurinic or apyrimidinic site) lyase [Ardenticatenaceae bacterium]
MPELPEVEMVARGLRGSLIGQMITEVRCYWPRHMDGLSVTEMQRRVHGRSIQAIGRRGKYLLFPLDDGQTLIIHLRMSGRLSVVAANSPTDKHTHTIFSLNNGRELRFWDQRKFGRVWLVDDVETVVGKLGPEPLDEDFSVAMLQERLNGRKRTLKPLLLDQTFVAGLGNIYADEALFYAGIHPTRTSDTLSEAEIVRLHGAMKKALQLGIARGGASLELYLRPDGTKGGMQLVLAVFRRTGESCYDCGTPIERIVLGGRSTHFCPHCQI